MAALYGLELTRSKTLESLQLGNIIAINWYMFYPFQTLVD